jgi:hypothetical protein
MTESEDSYHPKNRVAVHEIIINNELEQTKDFDTLDTPATLGNLLNK